MPSSIYNRHISGISVSSSISKREEIMFTGKRNFFVVILALVLLAFTLGGFSPVSAAQEAAAVVELSADQASFDASQPVVVRVTVSNPGEKPVKVLKWFTPVDDVEEPLFNVSLDGAPVSYLGAYYKRPEPKGDDYVSLKPGESFTREVNLATYYDLSVNGNYTVRYDVSSQNLFSEKGNGLEKNAAQLTSNELNLSVEGRQSGPVLDSFTTTAVTGSTTYNKCTTSQQTTLVTARAQASTYSANALSYLTSNTQGARYITWFGVYNSSRYSTVKSHFTSISSAMDTASVKFDCGCKKKYYAYVYPTQPFTIYLCSVYWNAPMTGTDSKAGTLIHEMSHFNVVASTDDYVYGQSGAKSLAISNPSQAINNADNHEYFAENTPALP
jgi:peptidyl-Lys metalloendopeptidase